MPLIDFCLSSVYETHLDRCSHIKAVWGIIDHTLRHLPSDMTRPRGTIFMRNQTPNFWVLENVRRWKFTWLYIPSLLLTVGWLPTRGCTCDRGRIVMDWMPRLRNSAEKWGNHLLNSQILLNRWKSTFTFFPSSFSQHLDERKLFLLFFSKSWDNDPVRRLVKWEDFGLNDWYLRHVLMGFKDIQRLVSSCSMIGWKIFTVFSSEKL